MSGFRAFLLKTNALALAIGVIIGVALGVVVNSLVNDIIMPPVGYLLGGVDFAQIKTVLKPAVGGDPATEVAIRWGLFLNAVIAFIVVALVVYLIGRRVLPPEPDAPTTQECRFCRETIPAGASKCKFCASALTYPPFA